MMCAAMMIVSFISSECNVLQCRDHSLLTVISSVAVVPSSDSSNSTSTSSSGSSSKSSSSSNMHAMIHYLPLVDASI